MKQNISYRKLIVNPENYRFDQVDNEKEAIDVMISEKGPEIYNLAKHISENGLDNAKDIRTLKRGNNFLVLDGNRRITALKCLFNPEIISDSKLKTKFNKLSKNTENIPTNIQCFVYDTEEEAAKWIKLDHTGKNNGVGQDDWGTAEINRFGYKFEGQISPAMQAVDLVQKALDIGFDTKKLKISTIDRILSNPEARSYLGIDIKDKKIILVSDKNEVVMRLNKLFTKVINDNVAVTAVYTKDNAIDFMSQLFLDKPKLFSEQKPLFPISDKQKSAPRDQVELNKQIRSDKKPTGLFFRSQVPYKLNNRQLQKLYDELADPGILSFPNATHDLLRSFLECSLIAYLKHPSINKFQECLSIKRRNENNITLTDMLDYLSSKTSVIGDSNIRKLAQQLISDKSQYYSVERMNAVNHNENWFSVEQDVRDAWEKIEPLIKTILNP